MKLRFIKCALLILTFLAPVAFAADRGIYINTETAVNTKKLSDLIQNAKEVGINTFVVDYERSSPKYTKNVQMIKDNGIKYIARVVIFPGGGTPAQVKSQAYLQKRANLIQQAINLGADEIQIDYIRYKASQAPSERNAEDIANVINYFSELVKKQGIPLQIDVFGISSFKPSIYIGQDNRLIAPRVSAICPMVYPSHYKPFAEHAKTPYQTVYTSLVSLKKQIEPYPKVKVIAFIEIYNFRYPNMSDATRKKYIMAQFAAVKDSGANGWYVWSAGNKYGFLFSLLKDIQSGNVKQANFRGELNSTVADVAENKVTHKNKHTKNKSSQNAISSNDQNVANQVTTNSAASGSSVENTITSAG